MSVRGWLRRRRTKRRWRESERWVEGPLREFVYLDEVSVYSLVASQVGLVVTEVTETQASSLQSEVSTGVGVSGPLKAEVGSKVQAVDSHGSQVLRKAIIQTTFKQLHDTVRRSGALRLAADVEDQATIRTLDDVRRLAAEKPHSPLVLAPSRLRRGDLIEMDVQLEPEPIFEAGMAVSGVLDIIQDDPPAFGVDDLTQLAQIRLASRMLDKVLAGLVPLRGRAVNYAAVQIDDEEWLVHAYLIAKLTTPPPTVPVFVVGVAQQGLFWKDVRRVLFSRSDYRVLARLNRTGVQHSWTPIKLVDVLSNVVPDFANVMDAFNAGVLPAMSAAVAAQQDTSPNDRVRAGMLAYAAMLSERAGIDITEAELEAAGVLDSSRLDGSVSVPLWREGLAPITSLVEERTGQTFSREVTSDFRAAALMHADLLDSRAVVPDVDLAPPHDKASERFLDSEIVALYW